MTTEDVRVVIVDDHADTRDGVRQLLELDGYNVRTAADAKEAISVIEAHQPVCVILDLALPITSGVELARQLRARYGSDTVLVVLTGSTEPDEIAAAEMAGADYILRKPLDAALLGRMLPRIT